MPAFLTDRIKLIVQRESRLKCLYNFLEANLARLSNSPIAARYPFNLNIEPTNLCNLHCPMCPTGSGRLRRKKGVMSFELFKKVVDEAGEYLFSIILFGYGEPFMCPDIIKMIRYAVGKKIWVWTSTNGHFFTDEGFVRDLIDSGLHYMLVCLDGLSQETLQAFRKGADFKLLIEGIEKVVQMRRKMGSRYPYLELQFIEMKHNKHEILKVKSFAKGLGFDRFSLKKVGISINYPDFFELAERYLPQRLDETGYFKTDRDGSIRYASTPRVSCRWLYDSPFINWDGTVTPCCYDLFGEYVLGDVSKQTLAEIWNNIEYRRLRIAVKKARDQIQICRGCPEGRRKIYSQIMTLKSKPRYKFYF